MTLEEIAATLTPELRVRTDKGRESLGDHNYLVKYEQYFNPIRNTVKKVVELGVDTGSSMELWRRYFLNAFIYGVDENPQYIKIPFDFTRMSILVGNYNDTNFMNHIKNIICENWYTFSYALRKPEGQWDCPEYFRLVDIIIDDGDHTLPGQINAIKSLGEILNKDGYYFVEDTDGPNVLEIKKILNETCLEFVEDYVDEAYGKGCHMCVLRRKR